MSKTATIRARIEPDLKNEVETILSQLGLTASETIHLLYRQIRLRQALPFEVAIPNELTSKVLRASHAGKNLKHFRSKKDVYADLGL
jgi:DNA-damage-inducible protein J